MSHAIELLLFFGILAGGPNVGETDTANRVVLKQEGLGGELVTPEQPMYRRFKTNVARRHDRGGLFRFEVGAVGVTPTSFETGGLTVAGQVAVGWLPWSRVGLHLTGFGWGTDSKGSLAAGPGVTFWFKEEGSLFISAAVGPALVLQAGEESTDETQLQVGGEVQLGLYRWVADSWSLGASIVVGGESIDLDGDGSSASRARAGLRLGVKFN